MLTKVLVILGLMLLVLVVALGFVLCAALRFAEACEQRED